MDNYAKSLWIVEQLYAHGAASFAQLAQKWQESRLYDGSPLSNATFRRRKEEIADRMNVEIVYDPARNVYEILNAEEISSNAVYQYLLGTFHIASLSSLAQKHRDRVQLQSPPTGIELLHTILEGIDRKKNPSAFNTAPTTPHRGQYTTTRSRPALCGCSKTDGTSSRNTSTSPMYAFWP